jgi:hypothetical protein
MLGRAISSTSSELAVIRNESAAVGPCIFYLKTFMRA